MFSASFGENQRTFFQVLICRYFAKIVFAMQIVFDFHLTHVSTLFMQVHNYRSTYLGRSVNAIYLCLLYKIWLVPKNNRSNVLRKTAVSKTVENVVRKIVARPNKTLPDQATKLLIVARPGNYWSKHCRVGQCFSGRATICFSNISFAPGKNENWNTCVFRQSWEKHWRFRKSEISTDTLTRQIRGWKKFAGFRRNSPKT